MKNWNAIRIMKLIFAIGFGIYAVVSAQYLFLLITTFLLPQIIFHNTFGCGGGNCNVNTRHK